MIQISADRQRARCVRSANERITTGLTGKAVTFRFGAGWENVTARTAVFEGSGVTRDCLIENGEAVIPHECLTVPGGVLRCGVYGVEGDKKTPTVYAELGQIERGADPSGDTSTDPTLAVWAQILARMGSLDDLTTEAKNTLVAAINEAANSGGGGGDGGYLWRPTVSAAGEISWERSKSTTAPAAESIKGPKGDTGGTGPQGETGPQGPAGPAGSDASVTKANITAALGYTPENAANKTTALSASSTGAQYPSAKAVWDALPHPAAKTADMTQAVGKDEDGKLWTAPGSGGSSGGGAGFALVYSWTADGTTMSAIDDFALELGKLYFCEMIVPKNGDLSANVTVPTVQARVGTAGNTYIGAQVGRVAGQQKYGFAQSRHTFFALDGTIHSVSDRTTEAQQVPVNGAIGGSKIYIYSGTSGTNILAGTTVSIYKLG